MLADLRGGRPARVGEAAQADGAALRAHRRGGRADAHRPVVRGDVKPAGGHAAPGQVDRAGRARGRGARRGEVLPRALGQHLQPVAGEHPGLVHLAPALVGSPDSRPGTTMPGTSTSPRDEAAAQAQARAAGKTGTLQRDPDVLDTWFSSALVASPRSAGPSRRATTRSRTTSTCPPRCWSPATTSSSSGSRA